MAEPFLAEVRMFGFNFPPRGYALCDGQILPINQNQSLYSLLGTTYGGDGRTSFGLPELRGRVPLHRNGSHPQGQKTGQENVSLTLAQMPEHNHPVKAAGEVADAETPEDSLPAQGDLSGGLYASPSAGNELAFQEGANPAVTPFGGGAHNNLQPSTVISFCIALTGTFPSRN
jgi:microcystin-dependent protein